jgi:26S proteasome regulatory subunit T3
VIIPAVASRRQSHVIQVEFPIPDRRQKRLIFGVCTSKMSLADDVDLESFVARPDKLSGAEIASVCLEAGMQAVRKNRYIIMQKDFDKAFKVVLKKDNDDYQFYK